MAVTIRALLADPRLGLTVRLGHEGLDQEVGWVAVSELPDPTPWLQGAELLLTSGMWLTDSARRAHLADKWASRLAAAGAKAAGFGIEPWFTEVPPEILQAVRRHRLTLLEVPARTPFVAVDRRVADLHASETRRHEAEVVRSQQRLVRAAQRGRAAVVATLAQELRGWVVVLDATHAPSEQAGALDADAVAGLRHIADEAAGSGKHSLLTALQGQPVYLVPLGPIDNRQGTLCVDGRSLAEDPAQRSGIVGAAAAVLSVLESTADASVQQVIVELLLADDSASARRVCKASGISLPDPLVAVGLSGPKRHQALARAVSLGAWRVPTRSATTVVVLAAPGIIETRLPTLVEQTGTRAGVSSPHSPKDVPRAIQEAMSSLTLAREGRRVVSYPETTSSGLKGVLGSESTRQFVAALFSPLEGHPDRQLLLTSASAWVHAHGRWDPAAEALSIHRETLRGRMKRLATTLSLDLDVPQDRLALSLAIQSLPPPEWEGWE